MKVFALSETAPNEKRVALSPDSAKKFLELGFAVGIAKGAGAQADYPDSVYEKAGVQVGGDVADADIVLCVQTPEASVVEKMKTDAILAGILNPLQNEAQVAHYAKQKIRACAMELMPRITRAQAMDVLSSQSNLAGYKAVLDATAEYGRALPMMMTAAGTVPAARVFVLGAGVAGLQAIATAKRLGAVVSATDVRLAAKEQVESLGASFVMAELDEGESGETEGGYAQEMSAEYQKRQAELIQEHIKTQDIVICTALVFGRQAPELVSKAMVESMQAGAVVVDLAVEQGGNCALSQAGAVVEHQGVKIVGHNNVPSRLAASASALYARNLYQFVAGFFDAESKQMQWDEADEILQAVMLTRNGEIVSPLLTKKE